MAFSGGVRFQFVCGTLESEVVVWDFAAGLTDAQVATNYRIEVWNRMKPFTAGHTKLVQIQSGNSSTGYILPVNETGTDAGGNYPPNCAYLITKKVTGGRSGRIYWPGASLQSYDTFGAAVSTRVTAVNNALNAALINLVTAGSSMSVRDKNGVVRPVQSLSMGPIMGTQRRRLRN